VKYLQNIPQWSNYFSKVYDGIRIAHIGTKKNYLEYGFRAYLKGYSPAGVIREERDLTYKAITKEDAHGSIFFYVYTP